MTFESWLISGGLTVLVGISFWGGFNLAAVKTEQRGLRAELSELKAMLGQDGRQSFVRARELELLVEKAEGEHRVINSEITTLRERVHGHEKVLGDHESRIGRLEEAT